MAQHIETLVTLLIFYQWCMCSHSQLLPTDQVKVGSINGVQQSLPPPENTADWVHPVIFEPQKTIRLTRSTFKVTTYIDFAPYFTIFQTVADYITAFKQDLDNPDYFKYLLHTLSQTHP